MSACRYSFKLRLSIRHLNFHLFLNFVISHDLTIEMERFMLCKGHINFHFHLKSPLELSIFHKIYSIPRPVQGCSFLLVSTEHIFSFFDTRQTSTILHLQLVLYLCRSLLTFLEVTEYWNSCPEIFDIIAFPTVM